MIEEKIKEKKIELTKYVTENIGKFAMIRVRTGDLLSFVKLHEMHLKGIEIGWITSVELHTDQESNQIKQHIYKTKLQLATRAKR